MKKLQTEEFWREIPAKEYLYASLGVDVLSVITILAVKNLLPPVVPILYGKPEGAEQLVPVLGLLIAPLAALIIGVVNLIIAYFLKGAFLKKILVLGTFLVSILSLITVLKVVFLVGFF
jgi:hypothetical protein